MRYSIVLFRVYINVWNNIIDKINDYIKIYDLLIIEGKKKKNLLGIYSKFVMKK